jgi:hypothetical protein
MQLALAYSPTHAGAEDWDRELAWLRRVVDVLGHKFVAGELDVAPSNLTDALLERERKDVKAKWVRAIVRMAPEEMRNEWVRMTTDSLGYEMPERKKTMGFMVDIYNVSCSCGIPATSLDSWLCYDWDCYCDDVDYPETCVFCELNTKARLEVLADNLIVAAGLCRAFALGTAAQRYADGWDDGSEYWVPGCGSPADG